MKKIPTLFKREFEGTHIKATLPVVTPGLEWVLNGEGVATVKYDGAACAIMDGELYKRYDAKNGKKPPEGAIPCCDPDPVTGHHPHWVKCDINNPADKWFFAALHNSDLDDDCVSDDVTNDGTYEAVGVHFQGNPYGLPNDTLIQHGEDVIPDNLCPRSFDGIKDFLKNHYIEGIVFWKEGEPRCKIKRTDFGFEWNRSKQKRR